MPLYLMFLGTPLAGPLFRFLAQTPEPPPAPPDFSKIVDWNSILGFAYTWAEALFPIFVFPLGIRLGVKLITLIRTSIEGAI